MCETVTLKDLIYVAIATAGTLVGESGQPNDPTPELLTSTLCAAHSESFTETVLLQESTTLSLFKLQTDYVSPTSAVDFKLLKSRQAIEGIVLSDVLQTNVCISPQLHSVVLSAKSSASPEETCHLLDQVRLIGFRECSDSATLSHIVKFTAEFHSTYLLEIGESVFSDELVASEIQFGRVIDEAVTLQHGLALQFRRQTFIGDNFSWTDAIALNTYLNEDSTSFVDIVRHWTNPGIQEFTSITDSVTFRRVQEYIDDFLNATELVQIERPIFDAVSVDEVVASLRGLSADVVTLSDQLLTNVVRPEDTIELVEKLTTSNVPATDQCLLQEQVTVNVKQIYTTGDETILSDQVARTLPSVGLDDILAATDQVSKGPLLEVFDVLASSDVAHIASKNIWISDLLTVYDKTKQNYEWLQTITAYASLYDEAASLTIDRYDDCTFTDTLQTEKRPARHTDVYEYLYVDDSWEGWPEFNPIELIQLHDLLSRTLTYLLSDDEVPSDSLLFQIKKPDFDLVKLDDRLEFQVRRVPIGRRNTWWRIFGIWR